MAKTKPTRRERAGLAAACGLAEPERGPLACRAAGPALPRRRVRAHRREGHDRVHDPGGHRPLEAVAARLLPVLRRQGRAAARAVRGDHRRVGRRPARGHRRRDRSARAPAGLHDPPARVVRSRRRAAQAGLAQPAPDLGVLGAARRDPPRPGEGGDGAGLADAARARRGRGRGRRRSRSPDTRRTAVAHPADRDVQLVRQPPRPRPPHAVSAEETWEFCLHGLSGG